MDAATKGWTRGGATPSDPVINFSRGSRHTSIQSNRTRGRHNRRLFRCRLLRQWSSLPRWGAARGSGNVPFSYQTAAAMEPPAARGLSHGVPHRSPWRALVVASPWAGDCCGVGTSTAGATTTSGLLLPASTGLFPGESTSIAVSEAALPVRTGRR